MLAQEKNNGPTHETTPLSFGERHFGMMSLPELLERYLIIAPSQTIHASEKKVLAEVIRKRQRQETSGRVLKILH